MDCRHVTLRSLRIEGCSGNGINVDDGGTIIEANERPGLANHEPQPTAEKFIDLLAHPEALRDPGYQAKIDANLKRTFLLLERLSATLTPVQRRHTLNRLEQLAAEMDQLACEPAPSRAESAM